LFSNAAGAVPSDEFVQVIAIWPIIAKRLGIKQSLDAAVGTDSIAILVIVSRRPTPVSVPAPAHEDRCSGAYSRSGNADWPGPAPKSPLLDVRHPTPACLALAADKYLCASCSYHPIQAECINGNEPPVLSRAFALCSPFNPLLILGMVKESSMKHIHGTTKRAASLSGC